jgi:hypothetical protein
MLPRISTANPSAARSAAASSNASSLPPRAVSSANSSSSAQQQRKDVAAAAVREAWNNAPSTHDILVLEARQELANRAVAKKVLVAPPTAPPPVPPRGTSAAATTSSEGVAKMNSGLPSQRPTSSSSVFRRGLSSAGARTVATDVAALLSSEQEKRLALLSRQIWEFEVVGQMAQVHYVNSVLMPLMNRTVHAERELRCEIRSEEAAAFSEGVLKSRLYSRLRQMRQEHDREQRRRARLAEEALAGGRSASQSTPDEAERILREYREQFELRERSPSLPDTTSLTTPSRIYPAADTSGMGSRTRPQEEVEVKPPMPPPRAAHQPAPPLQSRVGQAGHTGSSRIGGPQLLYGHNANVITLVQLRGLLDEMTYVRRMSAEQEQQHRDDIANSFVSERDRVQQLVDRRCHLERLIYWRKEREEKQRMLEQQQQFALEQEQLNTKEFESREEHVLFSEQAARTNLIRAFVADYHRTQRLLLEKNELAVREKCIEQQRVEAAMSLVLLHEHVARTYFLSHLYDSHVAAMTAKKESIDQLAKQCLLVRSRIITIQRAWRSVRLGLLGWRRTHRSIGFFIQKHRAELRVVKNRASLTGYRNDIIAELEKEAEEGRRRSRIRLSALEKAEISARELLRMDEALESTGAVRQFRNNFIKTVFIPQLLAVDSALQAPLRHQLEAEETAEWSSVTSSCAVLSVIIKASEEIRDVLAPQAREKVTREEESTLHELHQAFVTGTAAIYTIEQDRALRHRGAREALEAASLTARDGVTALEEQEMTRVVWMSKIEHFIIIACDPVRSGRTRVAQVLYAVLVAQHDRFAQRAADMVEQELLAAHRAVVLAASASILSAREEEARQSIATVEHADVTNLTTSEFAAEYARVEAYMAKRNKAASTIQRILRDCMCGRLGRSATLSYLRAFFWSRRERAFLRAAHEATRRAVMSAQEELDREIAGHNLATEREYSVLFREISDRIEPRRRDALVAHEHFIWQIHVYNFETYERELLRAATEQLREHESYQRVKIHEEYMTEFRNHFAPRKANFIFDVSVRPFQRAWRCHTARRVLREKISSAVCRVQASEEVGSRTRIELEWQSASALEIVKPMFLRIQLQLHRQGLNNLFHYFCFAICRWSVLCEESKERMNLLWVLQQHERYDIIDVSEKASRGVIYRDWEDTERTVREVIDFEGVLRGVQRQERTLFLLRVTASMELDDRAGIHEEEIINWMVIQTIYKDAQRSYQHQLQLLSHVEMEEALAREEIAAGAFKSGEKMALEFLYEASARDKITAAAANGSFFCKLVSEDEVSMRLELQRELRLFLARTNIDLQEGLGRTRIAQDWASKLVVQSGAGVLRAVPTFFYVLQTMEGEQRDIIERSERASSFWTNLQKEKTKIFSSSIRGGLHTYSS